MRQQSEVEQLGVGVAVLFSALVRSLREASPSLPRMVLSDLKDHENKLHAWEHQPKIALDMIATVCLRIEGK